MKPISPTAFISRGAYVHVPFDSETPDGTRIEDVLEAPFWSRLTTISRSQNLMARGQIMRLRAPDFTFDCLFVITGFRADNTPLLRRWPIDETTVASESVPPWKKRRADALATLGLDTNATDAEIKKAGNSQRAACHPDHSHDEADRVWREARSKAINAAMDLLLKKAPA